MKDIRGVRQVYWNPLRPVVPGRLGRLVPVRRRVRNFGDMLGPALTRALISRDARPSRRTRLLTIGSIMHFAHDGDVVWGTGVNAKKSASDITARDLDIRAVRGPLTARVLEDLGISVPAVYGDPGLLAPEVLGVRRSEAPSLELSVLPNLHDAHSWAGSRGFLSPREDYLTVMNTIAASRRVVTSSLHGLIIAEALGVEVALVRPGQEPLFKYEDYFEGTGRRLPTPVDSVAEALDRFDPLPPLRWDSHELLDAFPRDLWTLTEHFTAPDSKPRGGV